MAGVVHPRDAPSAQRSALSAQRSALVEQRSALAEQAAALRADLAGIAAATAGSNSDDEHDPEGATIAFERAQTATLLDRAEERMAALDRALARVDAGSYGSCGTCGRPIGADRLAARPDAETCIACASR